jgi:hypothetical protein
MLLKHFLNAKVACDLIAGHGTCIAAQIGQFPRY